MSASGFKYAGPGRMHGVPARDITAADFERMDGFQRRVILESGFWEEVKDLNLTARPRDELNTLAAQHGVADPAALPNKDAVIAAIDAAGTQE
jgi:hypothetical protein